MANFRQCCSQKSARLGYEYCSHSCRSAPGLLRLSRTFFVHGWQVKVQYSAPTVHGYRPQVQFQG
jgi:hypothetical protein